jgi:AbrB family looped-hinge helix DNA binding protein
MTTATVGKRFQVVIPREERRSMGIQPHDKVNVVLEGNHLAIYPVSAVRLRGIGRDLADGRDAVDYVRELRSEWGNRP